jgi:uncharacterized membrane protein HdeD (DUF308 family)
MIQTLIKNWWLLALCGVLDAIMSVIYLIMQDTDGSLTLRTYAVESTVVFLGKLALAAGVCTIAAGIWRSTKGKSWLLVLNGLALGALGLICYQLTHYQVSFRTIALLFVVMAMSAGIFELVIARTLRRQRHVADERLLGLAGAASVGFALAFLALAFRWIKLDPGSHADFLWFGSYFGFSAICMLGLGLRLRSLGPSPSGQWESLPLNPKHAH